MPPPGLILLAAGGSTRMGRPKQLLCFEGRSLLARAAAAACDSGCAPIVAVLGAGVDGSLAELAPFPKILVQPNPDWESGMGSSIRTGLERLLSADPDIAAAVMMLCDQPYVTTEHLRRLCEVYVATRKDVIATAFAATLGPPCLFSALWFDRLRQLPDAHGAKPLLSAARVTGDLATVELPAAEVDIDTPADYTRLISQAGAECER
jgi:molybdenum cofactor cytidylyltransferase